MPRRFQIILAACCVSVLIPVFASLAFWAASSFDRIVGANFTAILPRVSFPAGLLLVAFLVLLVVLPYGCSLFIKEPESRTRSGFAILLCGLADLSVLGYLTFQLLWGMNYGYSGGLLHMVLLMAGEVRAPKIEPLDVRVGIKGLRGSLTEFLLNSPEIVTASVKESEEAGWIRPSSTGGAPEQLWRARVTVGPILRGAAISGDIDIYFYRALGNFTGSIPRIGILPGDFYIFYLRKESGQWRTVCDFKFTCADQILTGWHPAFLRDQNRPLADDVLRLLVTPGEYISDGAVVDALEKMHFRFDSGRRWIDERQETYQKLLQQISERATPPVRAEAGQLLNDLKAERRIAK